MGFITTEIPKYSTDNGYKNIYINFTDPQINSTILISIKNIVIKYKKAVELLNRTVSIYLINKNDESILLQEVDSISNVDYIDFS